MLEARGRGEALLYHNRQVSGRASDQKEEVPSSSALPSCLPAGSICSLPQDFSPRSGRLSEHSSDSGKLPSRKKPGLLQCLLQEIQKS